MTGKEIQELRRLLKITQETAANIFGGGPVAFCKYENNDLTPSEPMDNLLWLVNKYPKLADDLAIRAKCQTYPQLELDRGAIKVYEISDDISRNIASNIASLNVHRLNWATACVAMSRIEPVNQVFDFSTLEAA